MPEVLDLRELGGDEPRPTGTEDDTEGAAEAGDAPPASGWRRGAAIGVVLLLGLAVAYMLTAGRAGGGGPASTPEVTGVALPTEDAARAALDAWARFASTGDIDHVRETFHPAGPQLARLNAEAQAGRVQPAGGAPYAFSATSLRVSSGRNDDEQVVAADVVVSRPGETDQRFKWELVMRSIDNRWVLWTVRDPGSGSTAAARGGP